MIAATCFSGIGAPEAAKPDWQWIWSAEIEPFPAAVHAARVPGSVNLGDVTARDFVERARAMGPIDVLVGGPPCVAFSVAGLRRSLADDRGNLSLRWVEIIHAVRPLWAVTENVPGWLSTNDNAFGCFLAGIVGADAPLRSPQERGRWPSAGMAAGPLARVCWRVLNAEYFGLAQRRERVFAVASFGNGDPSEVLFESQSVCGNPAPSREAGQRASPTIEARTNAGGAGWGTDFLADGGMAVSEAAWALQERDAKGPDSSTKDGHLVVAKAVSARSWAAHREDSDTLVTGAVSAKWSKQAGGPAGDECYNLVADPICANEARTYANAGNNPRPRNIVPVLEAGSRTGRIGHEERDGLGIGEPGDPMFTLQGSKQHAVAALPFDTTQITHPANYSDPQPGDPAPALAKGGHPPAVAFSCKDHGADAGDVAPTLRAMPHDKTWANGGGQLAVAFQPRIARNGRGAPEELAGPLTAEAGRTSKGDSAQCVAAFKPSHFTRGKDGGLNEVSPPLSADADKGDQDPVVVINGTTQETRSNQALRALREAVGEEAFCRWGLGINAWLHSPEVLRSEMHGSGVRGEARERNSFLGPGASTGASVSAEGVVRALWEIGCAGRPPQGWQPSEQLARELGAHLSKLSQQGASTADFLHSLWRASEGIRVLQQALHSVQEVRRSTGDKDTAEEGMFGLREASECEGPLRETLHASEESAQSLQEGGIGVSAVRRLTPR